MSATQSEFGAAVAIDHDVELIAHQIGALKELGRQDDREPITEGQRYDFSIRWGTVLAGRMRRLVHYSALGRLGDHDERRFRELCEELRTVSGLIDRFRLARPTVTTVTAGPATAPKTVPGGRHRLSMN